MTHKRKAQKSVRSTKHGKVMKKISKRTTLREAVFGTVHPNRPPKPSESETSSLGGQQNKSGGKK